MKIRLTENRIRKIIRESLEGVLLPNAPYDAGTICGTIHLPLDRMLCYADTVRMKLVEDYRFKRKFYKWFDDRLGDDRIAFGVKVTRPNNPHDAEEILCTGVDQDALDAIRECPLLSDTQKKEIFWAVRDKADNLTHEDLDDFTPEQ